MVNKVYCAYCDKELERLVFCSASHKVMFHRGGNRKGAPVKNIPNQTPESKKMNPLPIYKERKIVYGGAA